MKHQLFSALSNGLIGFVSSDLLYLEQDVDAGAVNPQHGICQVAIEDPNTKAATLVGSWSDKELNQIAPALIHLTVLHFKYSDLETINRSFSFCSMAKHLVLKDCFLESGELQLGSGVESLQIHHCDSLPNCSAGTTFRDVTVCNMMNIERLKQCARGSIRVFLNECTLTSVVDTIDHGTAWPVVIINDCKFDVNTLLSLRARRMALIACELLPFDEKCCGTVASETEILAVEAGLYKHPSLGQLIQMFPNLRHLSLHRIKARVRLMGAVQKLSHLETVTIDGNSANVEQVLSESLFTKSQGLRSN
jgi:hypothetical protein